MKDRRGTVVGLLWVLLSLLAAPQLLQRSVAQEEDPPLARRTEEQPKARPKSRSRLPLYFAKVVTAEQREEIYQLQAKFDKQIAELMTKVRDLEKQRDEEVQGVLTPEQQKEVAQMVEDARKRREALRHAAEAADDSEEATVDEEEDS